MDWFFFIYYFFFRIVCHFSSFDKGRMNTYLFIYLFLLFIFTGHKTRYMWIELRMKSDVLSCYVFVLVGRVCACACV